MKRLFLMLLLIVSSITIFAQTDGQAKNKTAQKDSVITKYACPMHPDVVSTKPGKCSKCGMDLVPLQTNVKATYTCPMHPDVVSDKPGKCSKCGSTLVLSKKEQMKYEVLKIYTCPMHANVISDKPGKCPKCGMTLVEKKKGEQ